MDRIFFTNSGTEAIEGAIKAAKKYAYTRDGHAGHEIIAMKHSFHGRSIGALSVTGNAHYQEPFAPLMPGVKFAEYNNLESDKELVTDKHLCGYYGDGTGRRRNLSGRSCHLSRACAGSVMKRIFC